MSDQAQAESSIKRYPDMTVERHGEYTLMSSHHDLCDDDGDPTGEEEWRATFAGPDGFLEAVAPTRQLARDRLRVRIVELAEASARDRKAIEMFPNDQP